jgi:hypothetical protein
MPWGSHRPLSQEGAATDTREWRLGRALEHALPLLIHSHSQRTLDRRAFVRHFRVSLDYESSIIIASVTTHRVATRSLANMLDRRWPLVKHRA